MSTFLEKESLSTLLAVGANNLDLFNYVKELQARGQLEMALQCWKKRLAEVPALDGLSLQLERISNLLMNYGNDLVGQKRFDEGLICLDRALLASPSSNPKLLHNIATLLCNLGRIDEGLALIQRVLRLDPHLQESYSNYLYNLHYSLEATPPFLAAVHKIWADHFMVAYLKNPEPHTNHYDRDPEKVLRIGLVSGDFYMHSVGILLVLFLENIDRERFTIHCYSNNPAQDVLTRRLQAVAAWQDIYDMSDAQAAEKIRRDGIDILIDLSGHTAGNRLGIFAIKPAPLQISWLGYPGHNGLPTMDYVIADRHVLPMTMQPYVQIPILHLPDSFVCFSPLPNAPLVSPLPAQIPGHIQLGCFNNPAKCGDYVLEIWADILQRLPHARLLFKYKGYCALSVQRRISDKFRTFGINPSRLEFQGESPILDMFSEMARVDLALDPFPFSGGMMTCFTLWMGVPVLTLPWDNFVGRQSLSFLSTIGMTDTIAKDPQDYCNKAVALAHDLPRLAELRSKLRPTMASSPLCDGPKAARALQEILRTVWRNYCTRPRSELTA